MVTDRPLLPWEKVLDAADAAQEATRGGDPDAIHAAFDRLNAAHDEMGALGGAMFLEALSRGGRPLIDRLTEVFGDMAREASATAHAALDRVGWALARLDAAEQRIRELQRRLDELTPGVGEPGLHHARRM